MIEWLYSRVPCPPAFEREWHALAIEIMNRIPRVHLAATKQGGVRDALCSDMRPGKPRHITDFAELVTCKLCLRKIARRNG